MRKNLEIDYEKALSQFEKAIKRFQIKQIIYKSAFRGKGLEFDGYRNFEKDDDYSMIDWKASLRGNRLMSKQYIEERDLSIYFIVDVSDSMIFGSQNKLKAEYSAEIVAALSHLIINSSDNAGLIMFSGKASKIILPSRSKNQFFIMTKYLSEGNLYGGAFDFSKAIEFVLKTAKPRSVVIFLSDFLHVKKDIEKDLRLLSTKFETMALMIRDPMDEELPKGNYKLYIQDPYSQNQMLIDPELAASRYSQISLKQKVFVKNLFKKSGIDLLDMKTDESFIVPLSGFLKSRARGGMRE